MLRQCMLAGRWLILIFVGDFGQLPPIGLDPSADARRSLQHTTSAAQRTELMNRPAVGISMLAGSVQALQVNLQEGLAQGVCGKPFVDVFEELCGQYDLDDCNRSLNLQDFPELQRSPAGIAAQ